MRQLLLYITKITASIIKMYVNLCNHVMIVIIYKKMGPELLSHPMMYVTLTLEMECTTI